MNAAEVMPTVCDNCPRYNCRIHTYHDCPKFRELARLMGENP